MGNEQQTIAEAEKDADPRIDLAVDRTIFALVRTQLAWIRTSITLLTAGFAIDKGFAALHEARMVKGEAWINNGHLAGLVMTISALLLTILVTINYKRGINELNKLKLKQRKMHDPCFLLSLLLCVIGALMLYFVLIS